MADDPSRSGERDRPRTSPTVLVATLSTIGIVVSLMQTLVVPLIPSLPTLLDTTPANASWVITATLLASAVCTPISGRLGDMFGKRRILLIDPTAMVIGSMLCATTSSLLPSVAGRALQGVAIGAIPLGISILRDELPPKRVGSAMAVMSSTLGVGGAIGLPVAGLLALLSRSVSPSRSPPSSPGAHRRPTRPDPTAGNPLGSVAGTGHAVRHR